MKVVVLGSAAGGGFPQWNCNGPLSRRARAGDPMARMRTQSSIAASADGERWVLFNASPDLRQQFNQTPQMHPRDGHPLRDTPISCVVLTNADIDHVAGLLTMREKQPYAIYGSDRVLAALDANPIFNAVDRALVERRRLDLGEAEDLRDPDGEPVGISVEPFAVPGKVALYLENEAAGANFGTAEGDTIGLRISETGGEARFYYIPGCAEVDPPLAKRLEGAPLVMFDGTLWTDDEMVRAGLGQKTGNRMGHISISGDDGTIAAFEGLGVGRKILIHINNTNPVLIEDSEERAAVEKAGWEVAYDGMELSI